MKFYNANNSNVANSYAATNTHEEQHPLQDYLNSLNMSTRIATESSSGRSSSTTSISSSSSSTWKNNKLCSKLINLIDCTLALVEENDFVNAHDDLFWDDHFTKSPCPGQ
jgi:hypothetical protein